MTAILLPNGKQQYFTTAGLPAVGYKIATFDAGTSNPRVTWQDAGKVSANTNPVILDGRGEASIFWEGAYKVQLQDSTGAVIWTQDGLQSQQNGFTASLVPGVTNAIDIGSAAFIWRNGYFGNVLLGPNNVPAYDTVSGNIGYVARTAAEIAAAISPTNLYYPELDVKRYGALGDGVADDSTAFTNAGKVARVNGGEVFVSKPPVQYLLTHTVDWTNGNTVTPQHGFVVRGCAGGYDNAVSGHILIKHNSTIAFDCSGTNSIRFLNLVIVTDAAIYPGIIFFRARNSINGSQVYRYTNVMFVGSASIAVDYNYGSEQDVFVGCLWYNNATDAGASVVTITSNNIRSITSTFITIATGNRSCITHRYYGCDFFMNSTNATADVFKLDNMLELFIHGTWMDCRGRSYIYVDPTNGTSSLIRVDQMEGENSSPVPTYGIYFGAAGSTQTPSGWMIKDSYIPSTTRAIFADTNVVLDNFYISNIQEAASKGLQATLLQNSILDTTGLLLVLGTSKQNRLTGDANNWNITTRSNDFWEDVGANKKTWVPVTTSMGATGAVTINEAHMLFHGSLVTLTLTMSAATSIISIAGTHFVQGLPVPCSNRSALVSVCNEATHIAIGTGMVDTDNKIWLPAINVGAGVAITITAVYFDA